MFLHMNKSFQEQLIKGLWFENKKNEFMGVIRGKKGKSCYYDYLNKEKIVKAIWRMLENELINQ